MARSTWVAGGGGLSLTVITAEAWLLVVLVSGTLPVTSTLFVNVPVVAGAVAFTRMSAEPPLAMLPNVQLNLWVPGLTAPHVPWEGVIDCTVTPAGRVSTAVTPVSPAGPLFFTVMVYVNAVLTFMADGSATLVTAKSTLGAAVVVVVGGAVVVVVGGGAVVVVVGGAATSNCQVAVPQSPPGLFWSLSHARVNTVW